MTEVASTILHTNASAALLHRLLADTVAWQVWSPHIAAVHTDDPTVSAAWQGSVRAFFSPIATDMHVTRFEDGKGFDWESTLGPWRLRYRNSIEQTGAGSELLWGADLEGPLADVLAKLFGPLSAYGQQRRMKRLARAAELIEAYGGR